MVFTGDGLLWTDGLRAAPQSNDDVDGGVKWTNAGAQPKTELDASESAASFGCGILVEKGSGSETKGATELSIVNTLPQVLSHNVIREAIANTHGSPSHPIGTNITEHPGELVREKKEKQLGKPIQSLADTAVDPDSNDYEGAGDDDIDDDNGMTTISLANDSQATEVTSNLNAGRSVYRSIGGSNAGGNADEATIATTQADADGTDHSVYEYVVHAYKTAKQNEKISFVDLYWDETAKRNRAEEERARVLQGPEDPETGSSTSHGKAKSDEASNRLNKQPKSTLLCCLQLYVAILFAATVAVGTMCGGLGMCVLDDDDKRVVHLTQEQKPFNSRIELINAVDQFLVDPSLVPSVYGQEGIGRWDVSHVTDFSEVFSVKRNKNVIRMNEDLSGWNTGQAEKMDSMFLGAQSFRGKGVSGWDVAKVKSMAGMFESCTSFDQNLSTWNTSLVENFSFMFARSSFAGRGISEWTTVSAVNMSYAFFELPKMDSDFSKWDTSRVVDLSFMVRRLHLISLVLHNLLTLISLQFNECSSFTGKGLENFDTSRVENMAQMFEQCPKFEGDMIGNWNTSLVKNMKSLARVNGTIECPCTRDFLQSSTNCLLSFFTTQFDRSGFNSDLSKWNTASVVDMSYMVCC